ncbi:unnamed protein product [Vitrella brassicaformis CCMP3155]|uniref:Uncharacterized protein n=1 Tax=Vitrella brassicaformis (strain CCMP3155) TaxID=1169540 RepID=A0A0G4FN39_VITBC|nr:unnamed protein product [Vitrella brassicaformis CCMP3155]|eukprot:CEM15328.1 unnamed protein product [Vitrella brassicaformis CCMP3155]
MAGRGSIFSTFGRPLSRLKRCVAVEFDNGDEALLVSEEVCRQYTFFKGLLDGKFQESSERSVTLTEISRPIAKVLLQNKDDMAKGLTRENLMLCLVGLDFLQPVDGKAVREAMNRSIARNHLLDRSGLCRGLLNLSFENLFVRELVRNYRDVLTACGPFVLEHAQRVRARWERSSSSWPDTISRYVVSLLSRLLAGIESGNHRPSLSTIKRFTMKVTNSSTFAEAAAEVFECERLAEEIRIEADKPGSVTPARSDGFSAWIRGLTEEDDSITGHYMNVEPPAEETKSSEDVLLKDTRRIEVAIRRHPAMHERSVFCYSVHQVEVGTCGDDEEGLEEDTCIVASEGFAFTHVDPHTGAGMPIFSMGLLRCSMTHVESWDNHEDKEAFGEWGKKLQQAKNHIIIRSHPMRCLVLHCLRMMICEGHWADIQVVGSSITREVAEHMAIYLANMTADGVSPLRVLTAWMSGWDRQRHMDEWDKGRVIEAAMARPVLEAHKRHIVPFMRVFACLVEDRMDVLLPVGQVAFNCLDVLSSVLFSVVDDDDGSEPSAVSGRPRKRRRIEAQACVSYSFFKVLLDGEFAESSERSVTLTQISRPIATVLLQKKDDIQRGLTHENLVDCLVALDFLQPLAKQSMSKTIARPMIRKQWLNHAALCRDILTASFRHPFVRMLVREHQEIRRAVAPFVVEEADHVQAAWTRKTLAKYMVTLLTCLLRSLEAGTCDISLSSLKKFITDVTRSGTFPEAAAEVFECSKLSEEQVVEITSPGDSEGNQTDDGRYSVALHGIPSVDDADSDLSEDDAEDMQLQLADVSSFKITADYCGPTNERTVFCYSLHVDVSIDTDKEPIKMKKAHEFFQGLGEPAGRVRKFVMGTPGSTTTSTLIIPFEGRHRQAFEDKDTPLASVEASVTIRHYPMRCLALHCLRLMIREGQWADIQGVGAAITRQVAEHMAIYLATISADGVSPLRVLTAWMAGWDRQQHLAECTSSEVSTAARSTAVMDAHVADLAPFMRVFGPLIKKGQRDVMMARIESLLKKAKPGILRAFIELGCGDAGHVEAADGGPRKRRRIELGS